MYVKDTYIVGVKRLNDTNNIEVVIPILASIISAFGGVIITHLLYRTKLRKERKAGGEKVISEQIVKSLLAVRKFELKLRTFEVINIEGLSYIKNKSVASGCYPEILDSKENLFAFQNELLFIIDKHQENLDYKSLGFLLTMQWYLSELMIQFHGISSEELKIIGTLLFKDFQSWQKDLDKHLVKRINKSPSKLSSFTGIKWNITRNRIQKNFFGNSELSKFINSYNRP